MRVEGSWTLENNKTDNDASMVDLVSFADRFLDFEQLSEKALVTVIENGKTTEARVDAEGQDRN